MNKSTKTFASFTPREDVSIECLIYDVKEFKKGNEQTNYYKAVATLTNGDSYYFVIPSKIELFKKGQVVLVIGQLREKSITKNGKTLQNNSLFMKSFTMIQDVE